MCVHYMWIDIIALIFSVAAFLFSLWQFKTETMRNRKEATIHAFDALEESPAVLYLFKIKKREIEVLVSWRNDPNETDDPKMAEKWELLSNALPLIEHFSVGINTKIYDIGTANRLAGNLLIDTWNKCESIIYQKQKGYANQHNYTEFKSMVDSLKNIRRQRNQLIPHKNNH